MKPELQNYILDIITNRKKNILISSVLRIFSWIYYIIIKIRKLCYLYGICNCKKLPCTVISVGNITVGGTGKTPAVIHIGKILQALHRKVAVISRGYKRNSKEKMTVVSDGKKILVSREEAGDEPYLIAMSLPAACVIVCNDRFLSGKYAYEKYKIDVIILDDGFQHIKLSRDMDIAVIDALTDLQGCSLLPRGILREPLAELKRAGIILLSRVNQVTKTKLSGMIRMLESYNPHAVYVQSIHQSIEIQDMLTNDEYNLNFIQDKRVAVLSSIGNSESFEMTIQDLGARILKRIRFPDHYEYTLADIIRIRIESQGMHIVTTAKDAVRLLSFIDEINSMNVKIFILKIKLQIVQGAHEWLEKIKQLNT